METAVIELETFNEKVEKVEEDYLNRPQAECPVEHIFAPGVYCRKVFMPKGAIILGHEHKTANINILLQGKIELVYRDGKAELLEAPHVFVPEEGSRKVFHILEDTIWLNILPTDETDPDKMDDIFIVKSNAWNDHNNNLEDNSNKEVEG